MRDRFTGGEGERETLAFLTISTRRPEAGEGDLEEAELSRCCFTGCRLIGDLLLDAELDTELLLLTRLGFISFTGAAFLTATGLAARAGGGLLSLSELEELFLALVFNGSGI